MPIRIVFDPVQNPGQSTKRWVAMAGPKMVGWVEWSGPQSMYTYGSCGGSVYNPSDLADINAFLTDQTAKQSAVRNPL